MLSTFLVSIGALNFIAFKVYAVIATRNSPNSLFHPRDATCVPNGPDVASQINDMFQQGGEGTIVSLCPNTQYELMNTIVYTAKNQELSTVGLPIDDSRATLIVAGPINETNYGMSTAVQANCDDCSGAILRHVQIDGNREDSAVNDGGANIEFGGATSNQLIEYVNSRNTRGWSSLHVDEGNDNCEGAIVRYNDIGPAGTDVEFQWADGISYACRNGLVQNNTVVGATDGGIVIFGAPGSNISNNVVQVGDYIQLGAINLVDAAYNGMFDGTVVYNNTIIGGQASGDIRSNGLGVSSSGAFIKIGIAMGQSVWFGNSSNDKTLYGATVTDNQIMGAVAYGYAIQDVNNFTVQNNAVNPNASFVGILTFSCPSLIPSPQAFVANLGEIYGGSIQPNFINFPSLDDLLCIDPPSPDDLVFPVVSL